MLLPIGNNCTAAEGLNALKLRTISYPFDWIYFHFDTPHLGLKMIDDVFNLKDDEVEKFCKTRFVENEDNGIKYGIGFPHDTEPVDQINDKYIRRTIRVLDDFNKADYVILIYISRDKFMDNELYELYDKLAIKKTNIYLFSVNGFKNEINSKYQKRIVNFNVGYDVPSVPWSQQATNYDQTIYKRNIHEIFRNELLPFIEYVKKIHIL